MDRYTIKDAEQCFERLLTTLGKRKARSYNDVGGWRLDYNPTYGGVIIEEIINPHGGINHPIIGSRLTSREFCQTINFMTRVSGLIRRQ